MITSLTYPQVKRYAIVDKITSNLTDITTCHQQRGDHVINKSLTLNVAKKFYLSAVILFEKRPERNKWLKNKTQTAVSFAFFLNLTFRTLFNIHFQK